MTTAEPTFATRAALHVWLEAEGLSHVARLNLEALAPWLPEATWPTLKAVGARRRLTDVAADDQLARSVEWLPPRLQELLPEAVRRFLAHEHAAVQTARAEVTARLETPTTPGAGALHARLLALRAKVPSTVAPRPESVLEADAEFLTVEPRLPGFRFVDPLPSEPVQGGRGGFKRAEVTVELSPDAPRVTCSCGARTCVHGLAALDGALRWLRHATPDAVARLSQPAWERTLQSLDEALEPPKPAPGPGLALSFQLHVSPGGIEVQPIVHSVTKKGHRSAGLPLSRQRLLELHGAELSPEDLRRVGLLPEPGGFATRALLELLVDDDRVVLRDRPVAVVRVEREPVGLVAEDRGELIRVSPGLDGTPLPPGLLERVRKGRPGDLLYLWDEGSRRLTLLDVKEELRAVAKTLVGDKALFPRAAQDALLGSLSRWAERVPVAMPRSVLGQSERSERLPVLRLEAQATGAVTLELRVRPLRGGPSFVPGDGPKDVHVRRGDVPVHVVRDLGAEVAGVKALLEALPLDDAEPGDAPFTFRFPSAHGALALLGAAAALDPAPELEWLGKPLHAVSVSSAKALRVVLDDRTEWFGVLGHLSVGSERVELARLLEATRKAERYVQVDAETWVDVGDALRAHLERFEAHAHLTRRGVEVGPAALEALEALQLDGATVEAGASWEALRERARAAREARPELPDGLEASLRPYQVEGYRWLLRLASWGAGGVLADDMGLGKTLQALAVLLARAGQGPALVVAPTSVAFNWRDEAKRFAPTLRLQLYADVADRDRALAALAPGDVLVVSYGLLVRDAARFAERTFATVVFDEAQNLKNAGTQRFHAAKALKAGFRFALSGTPLENHLGELWSLYALVFPTLLGEWDGFRTRFAIPIEKQLDPRAAPALSRLLQPFLLRRTKLAVAAELPPRTEVRVPVALSQGEWTLYEDVRLAALSDLNTPRRKLKDQQRRVEILAALTRLRLAASNPRLSNPQSELPSSKLERLLELVDELRAEGQRALVFSQFVAHLSLVREALEARGVRYEYLDGSTPAKERGARVKAFQSGDAPLFLISLKAGGVGLNLTAASTVIHLDPWWNPAVEDQASDRAHRLGQQQPVTIYRLVSMGTIEEQMLSLHARKRGLVELVLAGADGATRVSTEELLSLLEAPGRAGP
jgi:superfamily II DNA or RNA helicase